MNWMRYCLPLLATLLLASCTSTKQTYARKDASYNERLEQIVLIYVHAREVTTTVNNSCDQLGRCRPSMSDSVARAMSVEAIDLLTDHMRERLPGLVRASGIENTFHTIGLPGSVTNPQLQRQLIPDNSRARQALMIMPTFGSAVCHVACWASIKVTATVFDLTQDKKIVSTTTIELEPRSGFSKLDEDSVREFWRILSAQYKKDGLIN